MTRSLFALAAFAGVLVLTSTASAQTWKAKKIADIGGWTVNANSADDLFMNCEAMAPGGSPASLSKSSEGWVLKASSKAKADKVKGALDVDGKAISVTFDKFDEGKYGVFLKAPQLKALQGGKALIVKIGGEETKIAIDGLSAVTRKLAQCLDKGG